MAKRYVEEMWRDYERRVLPANASRVQRNETRRAFFAVAMVLFERLVTMMDPGTEPTEDDMGKMDAIHEELQTYLAEMAEEMRGPTCGS